MHGLGIYECTCMVVEFDARYAAGVLGLMLALFFCKSLLECVEKCMHVLGACAHLSCDSLCAHASCATECLALDHGQAENIHNAKMIVVLMLSAGKPLIIIAASWCGQWARGYNGSQWTVVFVQVSLNQSGFVRANLTAGLWESAATETREVDGLFLADTTEVDGLFLVMPYALISTLCTWTWISLKKDGHFYNDPVWDADLFEHRGMQLFEILYGVENFALFFALLSIAGNPVILDTVLPTALSLTLLLLYLFAFSRGPRSGDFVESAFGVIVLVLIASTVSYFLAEYTGHCVISHSAGSLTVALLILLSLLHASCNNETKAGSLILCRTLLSVCATVYFAALAAIDSNSACT